MNKLWKFYMADIYAWEQHARATNNRELLVLIELFKSNRITALCMAGLMLSLVLLFKIFGQ
jgi:hypothetical protein